MIITFCDNLSGDSLKSTLEYVYVLNTKVIFWNTRNTFVTEVIFIYI